MKRNAIVLGSLAALFALLTVGLNIDGQPARADVLEASPTLKWYRGNTHTHSHWSDGNDYLESIALWYRENDYDFLVFTDHNVLADTERWVDVDKAKGKRPAYDKLKSNFPDWVEEREVEDRTEVRLRRYEEVAERFNKPEEYLLIQGEEISDRFGKHPIHLNAHNVVEKIDPRGGGSVFEVIQNIVNALLEQRERTGQPMIIHLNHPNFGYAVRAEDIMRLIGENFFEVYNGHPGVHNSGDDSHASTERIWDIVLTKRLAEFELPVMYGLAVDDGHEYHNIPSRGSNPGRGWVMVLAEKLTPESLIESMEAGRFYSSSGVTLKRVESSAKGITVEVEPVGDETYTIEFIGTRKGYDPEGKPVLDKDGKEVHTTQVYSDTIGETFSTVEGTKATYTFTPDDLYVRARITSSGKHPNPSEVGESKRAWTQPATP